jgi:hypothetical protein
VTTEPPEIEPDDFIVNTATNEHIGPETIAYIRKLESSNALLRKAKNELLESAWDVREIVPQRVLQTLFRALVWQPEGTSSYEDTTGAWEWLEEHNNYEEMGQ